MPTDPKWRVIAKRSRQPIATVMAVFTFVMVNASANADERGRTHNLFYDDIAAALDIETVDVDAILDAMQGKVLEGEYLTGWEKRQPKREDNSAERAKLWRERKRTQENAEKRPDKDTDTDKEDRERGAPPSGDAAPPDPEDVGEQEAKPPAKRKAERGERLRAFLERQGENETAQAWGEWALKEGLSPSEINHEMQKFCDYWHAIPGQKGVKLDWLATWRLWVRRVLENKEKEEARRAVYRK
jgi:hypothetical protein